VVECGERHGLPPWGWTRVFCLILLRLRRYSDELFDLVKRGILKVQIGRSYALKDAAQAHRDVENRALAGSAVLVP
jgi:NADPH:quinone reductase-like Zn-dependent oxidoreductase